MKDNEVQGKLLTNKQVDQIMDWMFEFAEGVVDSTAVLSNLHFSLVVEDEFPTGRILSFQSTPEGGFCPDETGGVPVEDEVMSRDQAKKILRGLGLGELNEAPPGGYSLTALEEARIPRNTYRNIHTMNFGEISEYCTTNLSNFAGFRYKSDPTDNEIALRKYDDFSDFWQDRYGHGKLAHITSFRLWLEQE